MNHYLEIRNINNIVSIDDQYRYFHILGTLPLSNGAGNLHQASSYNDEYDEKRRFTILQFDVVNYWMYPPSIFLSSSTYSRYIAYIAEVNRNRLYGIRFKKQSTSPKVYIRVAQTVLGAAISKNSNSSYIFIEVVCSDSSTPINNVNAYQDYFEIIEIGDSAIDTPSGTEHSGMEIFNSNGAVIWKSSYKMVNIESYFNGNLAGSYSYPFFTTDHIIIPTRHYKRSDLHFFDGGFSHRGSQYKDFFTYGDTGLLNVELTIAGQYGDQYQRGAVWDGRDFGTDSSSNKFISGLILKQGA